MLIVTFLVLAANRFGFAIIGQNGRNEARPVDNSEGTFLIGANRLNGLLGTESGKAMLHRVSNEAARAVCHAADARARARRTTDATLRRDFLALERHWLELLESYQLAERISGC